MPYRVKKVGEDFTVVNSETGKQVPGGNHGDDEDKAKRHLAALVKNVKETKSMAEYDTALEIKGGPGSGRYPIHDRKTKV